MWDDDLISSKVVNEQLNHLAFMRKQLLNSSPLPSPLCRKELKKTKTRRTEWTFEVYVSPLKTDLQNPIPVWILYQRNTILCYLILLGRRNPITAGKSVEKIAPLVVYEKKAHPSFFVGY